MKAVVTQEGKIRVADVPMPTVEANGVLVKSAYSAISPGTEQMMSRAAHKHPVSLGYSSAGVVQEVGPLATHLKVGDRVACYGAPYVRHAEWLSVPRHLAVPIPDNVTTADASTVGLGAIAIHGLRQAGLQFGETAVVVGLGILGQLLAQIALAAGYRVVACDVSEARCALAESLGIPNVCRSSDDVEACIAEAAVGLGADAVVLCVSAKTGDLIDRSLGWIRDRGKVVVVGDLKMDFSRELMFAKEATVLISRAGGPGRYDDTYERQGVDYPIGFARWTEGRNMEAYLRLAAEGKVRIGPLLSRVVPVRQADDAFRMLTEDPQGTTGVVLEYR
ncbi:zinc-binding alcohol dehydrogenase [Paenibacillus sp.]|uniref:zinc-dependent alcohol dehydrogenase n=1 Tax=Paenibacillus sp. TaxID=58172 RepID=UPI0028124A13|nr:zinc-binding alcohol dehydrogenase [Paenibacillus sp.]